ncbi:hypothetical protein Sjap_005017 [Stephania japonica]|uniref:Terpene synthase N-terminal domain-containing protein n=1 Tax=Stephania japonica TaxID=461633 RepID=A0AAP0K4K8_9MAGN
MLNDKNLTELAQLELIDNLLRLVIGHIFESEIQRILSSIANNKMSSLSSAQGFHRVALRFKLLRLHGYEISRWWRDLGLCSHPQMHFARDRLVEKFLWTIGVIFDPQFNYSRDELIKVNSTIDDVYDVYGSLEELELFTNTVERWDIAAMEQLSKYMKLCFLALFNIVNQMAAYWADLCKAYLVEARWFHNKYTPKPEEFLENAWVSISAPVILVHSYFFVKQDITIEALQCLERYPGIIRWSSMILRLSDNLGTATAEPEKGDVAKSIQCYMKEKGVSEEVNREYIKHLIGEIWKKLNKERVDYSLFSKPFIGNAVNLARMAQCMYQYGDGHGDSDGHTKNKVLPLLVEPLSP